MTEDELAIILLILLGEDVEPLPPDAEECTGEISDEEIFEGEMID